MTPKKVERIQAKIKKELAADKRLWGGFYDDSQELVFANARPKIDQNTQNRNRRNRMRIIFRIFKPTVIIWS